MSDNHRDDQRRRSEAALRVALGATERFMERLVAMAEALLPDLPDDEREEAMKWIESVRGNEVK